MASSDRSDAFFLRSSPSTIWTLHRDEKIAAAEVRFVPKGVEPRHPVGRIHDRRNPSLPYTLAVCGHFVTPR